MPNKILVIDDTGGGERLWCPFPVTNPINSITGIFN